MPKLSEVQGQQAKRVKLSQVQQTAPQQPRPATYNLTGIPGVSTQVGGFLDGLQHRVMDIPHGIAQLVEHGVKAGVNTLIPAPEKTLSSLVTGKPGQPLSAAQRFRQYVNDTVAQDDAALAKREADYQARTRGNALSYPGAALGMVGGAAAPVGALRSAGALPRVVGTGAGAVAKKGTLLAAEGAVLGAMTPVTDGNFGDKKQAQIVTGAVAAPLVAGGMAAVPAAAGAVRQGARYLTPSGREKLADQRIARLFGSDDATLSALQRQSGVDGFSLTPGQAIGTPEAVQAERALRNNGLTAPAFAAQESANNAALRAQVAGVAKDDAAMQAAKAARSQVADAYRGPNLPEEGSPLVDAAAVVATLERLAKSANSTVRSAANEHLSMIRSQSVDGKVPAFLLDDIRQEAGGMLAKHSTHGAVGSKVTAKYAPVTTQIADTLDASLPGYRDYLASYARASQPINDMEAARGVLGVIDSGGRDAGGNQIVNLNPIKAMLAKDNRANFPMSDEARAQIEAVMEALQRRSIANNTIAASGPGTAADSLRGMVDSPVAQRMLGYLGSAGGGAVGGLPGFALGALATESAVAANNAVTRLVGEKAANSQLAAKAIEAYRNQLARDQGMIGRFGMPSYLLPYIPE